MSSRFKGFSFTITLRQGPKKVKRMLSFCLVIQHNMRVTPLGFCLRVSVNENPINLEKTTSSVIAECLLIYGEVYLSTHICI